MSTRGQLSLARKIQPFDKRVPRFQVFFLAHLPIVHMSGRYRTYGVSLVRSGLCQPDYYGVPLK